MSLHQLYHLSNPWKPQSVFSTVRGSKFLVRNEFFFDHLDVTCVTQDPTPLEEASSAAKQDSRLIQRGPRPDAPFIFRTSFLRESKSAFFFLC